MKLNHDYVRNILMFIEEELDYQNTKIPTYHQEISDGELVANAKFSKYNKQELVYALELLLKEHFIECANSPYFVDGNLMTARIIGLTWSGHELLDNVRNDTVWNAVKQKAKKFGGFSLSALANSAKAISIALMSDPNAINNFLSGIDNISKIF
jgi:hypothetical protein